MDSGLAATLDRRFCLSTNNNPLGLFGFEIYLVNLTTSSRALKGALTPPLKRKSSVSSLASFPGSSMIGVLMKGCPLSPPPNLSFPNFKLLRSVCKSIKPI